jgi:hypothetical protein
MNDYSVIEIRLTGEHIKPGSIRSRDIAEVIDALESILALIVERDQPQTGLKQEEIIIGLTALEAGSLRMQFQTEETYKPFVHSAYQKLSEAVANRQFDLLPFSAIEKLRAIRRITIDTQAKAELGWFNGTFHRLATLDRDVIISAISRQVVGMTTLYGDVLRVGGESTPSVKLKLIDGTTITCLIAGNAVKKRQIARALARKLYDEVGVRGAATWDDQGWTLQRFEIESVLDYEKTPLIQAAEQFRQQFGAYLSLDDESGD